MLKNSELNENSKIHKSTLGVENKGENRYNYSCLENVLLIGGFCYGYELYDYF